MARFFGPFHEVSRFLCIWAIFTKFRALRSELIARCLAIFLNLRPETSSRIARFPTNLSPEIVARKLVAVKVIPFQKSLPYVLLIKLQRKSLFF